MKFYENMSGGGVAVFHVDGQYDEASSRLFAAVLPRPPRKLQYSPIKRQNRGEKRAQSITNCCVTRCS